MTPGLALELNPYQDSCSMISSINDIVNIDKKLIQTIDLMGRKSPISKNKVLFYIYDDGSVEKKIIIF